MLTYAQSLLIRGLLCFSLLLPGALAVQAQGGEDSTQHSLELDGYLDAYYARYGREPASELASFVTVGPRDANFGLNIAMLTATYTGPRVRADVGVQAGDIVQATWSPNFPAIQRAYVGYRVGEGLWVDGGFFVTHIGMESFLPREDFLSRKAFATFNEPYFQSGIRLSSEREDSPWTYQLWLIGGQNAFVDNNRSKSGGVLVQYRPAKRTTLSFSGIYGNEAPSGSPQARFLAVQNAYWIQEWAGGWATKLALTYGRQTNSRFERVDEGADVYDGILTLHYPIGEHWGATARAEYYNDALGGIFSGAAAQEDGTMIGLEASAFTLGLSYEPFDDAYVRLESRYVAAPAGSVHFASVRGLEDRRFELLVTAGYSLQQVFRW